MCLRDDLSAAKAMIDTLERCDKLDIYGALRAVDEGGDRFTAMQDALRAELPGRAWSLAGFYTGGRASHRRVMALFKRAISAASAPPIQVEQETEDVRPEP